MRISSQELEDILTERYRGLFSGLFGVTMAGVAFTGLCYLANPQNISSDLIAMGVALFLLVGWSVRAIIQARVEKSSKALAEILESPPGAINHRINPRDGTITIEKTGEIDFGFGNMGAVVAEVAITFEEARKIGFAVNPNRGLPLLLGAGDSRPLTGAAAPEKAEAAGPDPAFPSRGN